MIPERSLGERRVRINFVSSKLIPSKFVSMDSEFPPHSNSVQFCGCLACHAIPDGYDVLDALKFIWDSPCQAIASMDHMASPSLPIGEEALASQVPDEPSLVSSIPVLSSESLPDSHVLPDDAPLPASARPLSRQPSGPSSPIPRSATTVQVCLSARFTIRHEDDSPRSKDSLGLYPSSPTSTHRRSD